MNSEILDQLLHFGVAFIATAPTVDSPLAGACIGLIIGLVREHAQMQATGDRTLGKSRLLDLAFWLLGGLVGGLI